MGVITGLKGITDRVNEMNSRDDRPKTRWLKLEDGQSVRVHFLQELDQASKNYNEKAGLAIMVSEHTSPENFRHRSQCTINDEGRCYACEMNRKHPKKGWHAKGRIYFNVLVDDGKEDPYVAVLSQGLSGRAITPALLMHQSDTESICNAQFRIARNGAGVSNTSYSLMPVMNSQGVDPDNYTLYDLEQVATRYLTYDEQVELYGDKEEEKVEEEATADDFSW